MPSILIAIVDFSLFEALLIATVSTAAQCIPKDSGKPRPVQMLFNVSTVAVAVALAELFFQSRTTVPWGSDSLLLCLAAASFFFAQTIPVATIISLTEGGSVLRTWSSIFHLSFSYYVLNAGVASLVTAAGHRIGWQIPLLLLPVMYGVYTSYQLYFSQPERSLSPMVLAKPAGSIWAIELPTFQLAV